MEPFSGFFFSALHLKASSTNSYIANTQLLYIPLWCVCSDTYVDVTVFFFFALHLQNYVNINTSATKGKLLFLWQSKLRMCCL